MRTTLAMMSFGKIVLIISILSLCFHASIYAADIKLQWDANTEPDLDHYVVYWGLDSFVYSSEKKGDLIDKDTTTYTVTGLSDGKTYYFTARAFDIEGLKSDYSNIVSSTDDPYVEVTEQETPPSGSGAGGGGCFIATAAYGSKMDKHVKILTEFKDKRLVTNPIGRSIVDAYYKFSPPVASYLYIHHSARAIVRYALIPIISIAYLSLFIHPLALLFAFFFMLLIGVYFFKRSAIRRQRSAM